MVFKSIIGATCACLAVISFNSSAALIERLGGLAYYDNVADLTWLADANAGAGSIFDDGISATDGLMTWQSANDWAASLDVAGVTGWRLADTVQPDASCSLQSGTNSWGYYCTGSEMGNLFYTALGNSAGTLSNTGPFSNVQSSLYWSATEVTPLVLAWTFNLSEGIQDSRREDTGLYAWAVQSGDVSAVPVPAAVWLFGSGLVGLIGLARRKKA